MKKFFIIFSIVFSIASTTFAQKNTPILINPREWTGWQSTTDGFPDKIIIGKTEESKAYIFDSPISIDENGVVQTPYMYQHPTMQVWIARGGKQVQVTAEIVNGPRTADTWKKIFASNRYAIPVSNDGGRTYSFAYNEPILATAYQIGYSDENGYPHVRYEIKLTAN